MPQPAESLLTFPCAFPIKVMGRTRDGFAQAIVTVVQRHAPDFDAASVEMRASSAGKYLSVTCTINATSARPARQPVPGPDLAPDGGDGALTAACGRAVWRRTRALHADGHGFAMTA